RPAPGDIAWSADEVQPEDEAGEREHRRRVGRDADEDQGEHGQVRTPPVAVHGGGEEQVEERGDQVDEGPVSRELAGVDVPRREGDEGGGDPTGGGAEDPEPERPGGPDAREAEGERRESHVESLVGEGLQDEALDEEVERPRVHAVEIERAVIAEDLV